MIKCVLARSKPRSESCMTNESQACFVFVVSSKLFYAEHSSLDIIVHTCISFSPFSHTHYQSPCSVDFNMPTPSIFSRQKPARPPIVPTDTIVPLHFFDDQPIFRAIVLNFSFRFDDVLDPEKLRTSLTRLIECGTWKKLGARLRQSVRQETDLIYVITGLIRTI